MKYVTDKEKTRGICSFYPETKKETKAILKLYIILNAMNPNICDLDYVNSNEEIILTMYNKPL